MNSHEHSVFTLKLRVTVNVKVTFIINCRHIPKRKRKHWFDYRLKHILPITSTLSILSLVPQPSEFLPTHWYTSLSSWSKSIRLMTSLGLYTSKELPVYLESEMLTSTWFLLHFVSRVGGKSVLLTTVHWITRSDRYGMSGQPYGVIVRRGVPLMPVGNMWIQFENEIKHSGIHIKIQTHVTFETPLCAVDCLYCNSLTW